MSGACSFSAEEQKCLPECPTPRGEGDRPDKTNHNGEKAKPDVFVSAILSAQTNRDEAKGDTKHKTKQGEDGDIVHHHRLAHDVNIREASNHDTYNRGTQCHQKVKMTF